MKKLFSLLTALVMAVCLFAGCGDSSSTPASDSAGTPEPASGETKITDGYYYLDIEVPLTWVHFNEDGTYYMKCFAGSVLDAGTWELVDEPTEHYVDTNGNGFADDDERGTTVQSPQSVVMTSYSTGTPVYVAYEDDTLCDMVLGGGLSNHRFLWHKADYEYNADVDETAIQLFVFYANNDIASNFILNHNRTFEDVTGDTFDSGMWEMTGAGEYALTYDFGGTGTLTVEANGKSGVLTRDGVELALRDDYKEAAGGIATVMSLRAEDVTVPELPMTVNVRLDGYSDGACEMIVEVAQVGAELIVDQGTFEVSPAMEPTFHFDTAGDIVGAPDYGAATPDGIPFTVTYSAAVETEFNGSTTAMTLDAEVTGIYNPNAAAAEAQVVASFRMDDAETGLPMPVGLRIDCYDDNTAKLIVEVAQVGAELEADAGTYEISPAMQFTFSFDTAGEVVGEPDYGSATETSIDVNVAYAAAVEVEFNGTTTPLTIDSTLSGTYSIAG